MHPDILQAHKRRLHHLQVQAARMGYDTPPHILMEIEDVKKILKDASAASVESMVSSHHSPARSICDTPMLRRLFLALTIPQLAPSTATL
jgi:hypothetical protein